MKVPWVLIPDYFPPDEGKKVREYLRQSCSMDKGGIQSGNKPNNEVRRSQVGWPSHKTNQSLFSKISTTVKYQNQKNWGFELGDKVEWQLTHYTAEDFGFYQRHIDMNPSSNSEIERKLSVTLQLSDPSSYHGGTFEFGAVTPPSAKDCRKCSALLIFPSFIEHGVTPLLAGERWSLVAWFSGPLFR